MKVAVVGSRSFLDYNLLKEKLEALEITEIVSGGANGADKLAERYAKEKDIPVIIYKPDWAKYKSAAGPIRNKDIVAYADMVVAFWDGTSKGTLSSINLAKAANKPCNIFRFTNLKND